jgi:hypothetical protein
MKLKYKAKISPVVPIMLLLFLAPNSSFMGEMMQIKELCLILILLMLLMIVIATNGKN